MDIRLLFVVIVMGTPLCMLDCFLLKLVNFYINKIKQSKLNGRNRRNEYIQLILIIFIIIIISLLIAFLIAIALAPNIIRGIPIVIAMLIMTFIMAIYGCFAAVLLGLKDVVYAGGSAAKVMESLSNYIYEYLNDKKSKESGE